jgi:hypothetical protein
MIEELGFTGPGFLSGVIKEDEGFRAPGDPIPGVDVKLGRNPGGEMMTSTETNSGGAYSFNVPYGSYTIFADIPGMGCDSSYTVIVDSLYSSYTNLNYTVDSTNIHIVPSPDGINETAANNIHFTIYPNPSKGNATIEYKINSDAKVELGIYNILGVQISEMVSKKQTEGIYRYNLNDTHLSSGVYFIVLTANDQTNIKKIIITE